MIGYGLSGRGSLEQRCVLWFGHELHPATAWARELARRACSLLEVRSAPCEEGREAVV